jgi:hypothetical protein
VQSSKSKDEKCSGTFTVPFFKVQSAEYRVQSVKFRVMSSEFKDFRKRFRGRKSPLVRGVACSAEVFSLIDGGVQYLRFLIKILGWKERRPGGYPLQFP